MGVLYQSALAQGYTGSLFEFKEEMKDTFQGERGNQGFNGMAGPQGLPGIPGKDGYDPFHFDPRKHERCSFNIRGITCHAVIFREDYQTLKDFPNPTPEELQFIKMVFPESFEKLALFWKREYDKQEAERLILGD